MILMIHNDCFARCEDGVGMEGMGAWRYGPRITPKCAHRTCFTNEWVVEILLHITYAGQCLLARVHDKLLGPWFGHVWPSRWVLGDYCRGYLLHYSLSRWGAPVNLEGTGRGGDPLSVQNYIDIYCAPGTQNRGSCIPIAHIRDLPLQVLTSTIVRVAGSSSLHLATWN